MNYKGIIFDLGNVVFNVDFNRIYVHWAEHSGVSFDKIKNYFESTDYFDLLERGDLSEDEYRSITNKALGMNLPDNVFDEGLTALYLDEFEGINPLLKSLKNNYRIIALSNTNSIHKRVWRKKYEDTMDRFEIIFCSHEINSSKPELKPYLIALDYLKLKAEEVIFLDDKSENIEPAKQLGIKTITVTSPAQMRIELKQLVSF